MTPVSEDERLARAGLTAVCEPGDVGTARSVAEHGAVEVWRALDAEVRAAAMPARHLARVAHLGGRLLVPGDEDWPLPVDRLATADYEEAPPHEWMREPLALWVLGPLSLADASARAVAVVGARAASGYGLHVAAELGTGLALRGAVVVSGAAFGIDAGAHKGAIAGDAPTVAVLAGGVDVPYPRSHIALLERIRREGSLVSEVPPGYAPFRQRFLRRNRLIAALSRATVLVEAGPRSGALNTCRHARAIARPVLAVPGPVTSPMSVGCNRLIRSGHALLATDADDVLGVAMPLGSPLAVGSQQELALEPGGGDPRDGLRAEVARLLDAVPSRSPAPLDRIAAIARVAARQAAVELSCLEEAGLVEHAGGGWRLTAMGRRPSARDTPVRG